VRGFDPALLGRVVELFIEPFDRLRAARDYWDRLLQREKLEQVDMQASRTVEECLRPLTRLECYPEQFAGNAGVTFVEMIWALVHSHGSLAIETEISVSAKLHGADGWQLNTPGTNPSLLPAAFTPLIETFLKTKLVFVVTFER
jgi:hypothetical protein